MRTKVGDRLRFLGFKDSVQDSGLMHKLYALGFAPHVEFTIDHQAPFHGPLVLSVLGTSIMLRHNELACMELEAVA